MFNPLKEAAPWARLSTLVILGLVVIYGIGRWDSALNRQEADLRRDTQDLLRGIQARRQFADSIATLTEQLARKDSIIAAREAAAVRELATVRQVARQEVVRLEATPLDSLLPPLRLEPLRLPEPDPRVVYATDSAGVRFLAGGMLRLAQGERERAALERVAAARADRIEILLGRTRLLEAVRDTLAGQLDLAAPLLERWQRYSSCKILGLLPCPSRTTSAVLGVAVGVVATVALTRGGND